MNPGAGSGYDDGTTRAAVLGPETEFLDLLIAYRQTPGQDRQLDLSRKVLASFNYFPYICGWPDGPLAEQTFAAFQAKEGSVTINARAILMGITAYCSLTTGMKLTVTDKGSGLSLTGQPLVRAELITSKMDRSGAITSEYPAFGPFFLLDPVVVTPPGQFQIAITNLSPTATAICQIALIFAVPANDMTLNTNIVHGGLSSRGKM